MKHESRITNHGLKKKIHSLIHYSLFFIVFATLTLTGLRCTKGPDPATISATKPVVLRWWRVFDDEGSVRPIIEAYRALHPNVTIQYRKIRFEDYEQELLNALAEDRGPDIISVHNSWMRAYLPKLAPMPPDLTIPFQQAKGGILSQEVETTLRTYPTLSKRALSERFVDAVSDDAVISARDSSGQARDLIFGLPLALDTLALYANRDLFNLEGIPEIPKTWTELQQAVRRLTKISADGAVTQSGAGIGAGANVERAADILSLLMMQNGAQMTDSSGAAAFQKIPPFDTERAIPPGEEALIFYTDFANPVKEVYTWPADGQNSFDAFISGRSAIFFGYSYNLPIIRARAPRINLAVAPIPQIEGNPKVNFANYWLETVSLKSLNSHWAWDFILFATSAERAAAYLEATGKPTALRALIANQLENEKSGIFASQVLTAKSWYQGVAAAEAEQALIYAIDAVLNGAKPTDALKVAAQRINQTLR